MSEPEDKSEPTDKKPKGLFQFSVRFGLGDKGVEVNPLGGGSLKDALGQAVKTAAQQARESREESSPAPRDEVREPLTDFFDEPGGVLVVAEMPGIELEDLRAAVSEQALEIEAVREDRKYKKRIVVPENVDPNSVSLSGKNGIFEVRCAKR